ncbi:MAG: YIP1 family protein [Fibrobacterota bacterium]
MIECSKCGTANFALGTVSGCRVCGYSLNNAKKAPFSRASIAWDRLDDVGVFPALASSLNSAVLHPFRFSKMASEEGNTSRAILFAIIISSLTSLFGTLISLRFPSPSLWAVATNPTSPGHNLILVPFTTLLGVFFLALYTHSMLFFSGSRKPSFTNTVRIISYAHAVSVLSLIPYIGIFLSGTFFIYILLSSSANAFQTSRGKAALFLLLPCFLFALVVGFLLTAITGSGLFLNNLVKEMIFSLR